MGSRSVEAVKNIEEKDALRVKGLRKVYDTPDGKLTAVDGVDMTMERGKIFALLGHNGAGKTTTLSILTGLTPDSGGDVSVFGCRGKSRRRKRRATTMTTKTTTTMTTMMRLITS